MSKIVYIDVDGVVADLMTPWLAWYNLNWDDDLTRNEITTWNFHDHVKSECGIRIYEYLSDPAIYDEVSVIPGALSAVKAIEEFISPVGGKVVFVTSTRPAQAYRKFEWLAYHGFLSDTSIKSQRRYIEMHDKSLLDPGELPDQNILIDDGPDNVLGFKGHSIVFDQPWNRDVPKTIHRRYGWNPLG